MRADDPLYRITRYLRFPLTDDHRAPLQDGSRCPHCLNRNIQKWGRFSGRQRYRCRGCGRTFSTFTGTALHYLKHPQLWQRFLWCADGRLTVRASAAVLGVNKDTALRWRHRLLGQWCREPRPRLKGRLVIGDFCIPRSDKGARTLSRPARRRGQPWTFRFLLTDPVTVLVAWESPTALALHKMGSGAVTAAEYEERLAGRVHSVTGIVGSSGPASPLGRFAARLDVPYHRDRSGAWPREVFLVRRELRAWLRPFRGVSSRWLQHYLEWFRRRGGARAPTVPADRARWGRKAGLRPSRDGPREHRPSGVAG